MPNASIGSIVFERQGRLLVPPAQHPWWRSHAQLPTVLPLSDERWRIYFGARGEGDRSQIVYADFDPSRQMRRLDLHDEPLLEAGPPGSFDQAGMLPSCAIVVDGRVNLYYIGVSLRRDVPAQLAIGLAVSDDGGMSFQRACAGPILSTGPHDPILVTAPQVLRVNGGYRMWYVGATAWVDGEGGLECNYEIRQADSANGIDWNVDPRPAIALGAQAEGGLARPWVFREGDGFRMVFSRRGERDFRGPSASAYRLGHACSRDAQRWTRDDARVGFAARPEAGDWDGWMQAYACIQPFRNEWLMFYNGNGFGRSGFGWARARLT